MGVLAQVCDIGSPKLDAGVSKHGLVHWPAVGKLPSSFTFHGVETQVVHCKEGFVCASKVAKFGLNHEIGSELVEPNPETLPSDSHDYEWGCPHEAKWNDMTFDWSENTDAAKCTEKDCMCIARASNHVEYFVKEGTERMKGKFEVQIPDGKAGEVWARLSGKPAMRGGIPEEDLTVIPHYLSRGRSKWDPADPARPLGAPRLLPRDTWMNEYTSAAKKLQYGLDDLSNHLQKEYDEHFLHKTFSCDQAKHKQQGYMKTLSHIRRFLVLSSNCGTMRDTVARLAKTPILTEAEFSGDDGKQVGCILKEARDPGDAGAPRCKQLNCYRGPEDADLRAKLADMKAKLDSCRPDTVTPDESGYAPTKEEVEGSRPEATMKEGSVGFVESLLGAGLLKASTVQIGQGRMVAGRRGKDFL